jgi:hypothetical protein
VQIRSLWRPLLSDPADDMVLEITVNGRADLLATFNQKDFAAVAKSFALKCSPSSLLRIFIPRGGRRSRHDFLPVTRPTRAGVALSLLIVIVGLLCVLKIAPMRMKTPDNATI